MRFLYALIFALIALPLSAQQRAGKVLISGNTSVGLTVRDRPDNGNVFFPQSTGPGSNLLDWRIRSSRVGYHFTERFLFGTDAEVTTIFFNQEYKELIKLRPFARYYFSDRQDRRLSFFGQLGIGTFGDFEFNTSFETDFHFGAGLEYNYGNDLAAEALLRYNANASGLNYTELSIRINTFIGGGNGQQFSGLRKGAIMIDPTGGTLSAGFRGRDDVSRVIGELTLGGGYMITNHLLVEAGASVYRDATEGNDAFSSSGFRSASSSLTEIESYLGARYVFGQSRLRPYIMAGASFRSVREGETNFGGIETTIETVSTTNAYGGAGFLFGLTKRVMLDGSFSYHPPLSENADGFRRARLGLKVFLQD